MSMKSLIRALLFGSVAVAGSAHAILVDFTDEHAWTVGSTSATSSVAGGVKVTASGGKLTLDNPVDKCNSANSAVFGGQLACDTDGAGVDGPFDGFFGLDDEAEDNLFREDESLTVTFLAGAREVTEILLLDLFPGLSSEKAKVSWDGGSEYISGTSSTGGRLFAFSAPVSTTSLTFEAVKGSFALGGVSVVPVPAAVWLFASALLGLVGLGRTRRIV